MNEQRQNLSKTRGVVDLVFLIDATGSMRPCIDALKDNIATFVSSLTGGDGNRFTPVRDWRAKVVGFRDFEFDAVPIEDYPFTADVDVLHDQLESLHAEGGDDEPESLLEALYAVATMPATERDEAPRPNAWRHRASAARIVVIFSDASFKEPLMQPAGATIEDVFNVIQGNRIILSIFAPDLECYERLSEVDKAEWNVVEGGSTPQKSLAKFTSDQRNFANTLRQLAKTISKTAETELL